MFFNPTKPGPLATCSPNWHPNQQAVELLQVYSISARWLLLAAASESSGGAAEARLPSFDEYSDNFCYCSTQLQLDVLSVREVAVGGHIADPQGFLVEVLFYFDCSCHSQFCTVEVLSDYSFVEPNATVGSPLNSTVDSTQPTVDKPHQFSSIHVNSLEYITDKGCFFDSDQMEYVDLIELCVLF